MKGLLVGGALTLFGATVGFALGAWADSGLGVNWWEVLTAVGTLGAVCVALLLALASASARRYRDRLRGAFYVVVHKGSFERLLQAGSECRSEMIDHRGVDGYDASYSYFNDALNSVATLSIGEFWRYDARLPGLLHRALTEYQCAAHAISTKERGYDEAMKRLTSGEAAMRSAIQVCELAESLIENPSRWRAYFLG